MLMPSGTATNNGTKGNPCLVADIFGDFREELLLRLEDDSAIRIYTSTDLTHHKLFTLLHDPQYRCGVAWQNNCYNQPGYPSFYYASDMDFANVLPQLRPGRRSIWPRTRRFRATPRPKPPRPAGASSSGAACAAPTSAGWIPVPAAPSPRSAATICPT